MTEPTTLTLTNEPSELNRVTDLLTTLCAAHAVPPDTEYDLNLALDEIVTNVIRHAYADGETHQFTVRIALDQNEFVAQIEDDGREFNPVAHPTPDLDAPLAQRKIGGLGIHLVRNIMDVFDYQRAGGKNVVTLRKKIGGVASS